MNFEYYQKQVYKLAKITEASASKQLSFFQSLLIASVTLLGILISLHDNTINTQWLRLLFSSALVLLSLGILSIAIVVYDWSMMSERIRQVFRNEVQKALSENRPVEMVTVDKRKRTKCCEKITYTVLPASLLLLTTYAVLSLFS